MRSFTILYLLSSLACSSVAFSFMAPQTQRRASLNSLSTPTAFTNINSNSNRLGSRDQGQGGQGSDTATATTTRLHMSSTEKSRTTKKTVQVKDRVETKPDEQKNKEEMWRVVLHNDEVHTFNYVVRSLCKVIGTLDRKAAFEICVQTHGVGKATITKSWKKQAETYCLGMQRRKFKSRSVVFRIFLVFFATDVVVVVVVVVVTNERMIHSHVPPPPFVSHPFQKD
jgi:ATP-dependent Clp protease adapter protein ClpS